MDIYYKHVDVEYTAQTVNNPLILYVLKRGKDSQDSCGFERECTIYVHLINSYRQGAADTLSPAKMERCTHTLGTTRDDLTASCESFLIVLKSRAVYNNKTM